MLNPHPELLLSLSFLSPVFPDIFLSFSFIFLSSLPRTALGLPSPWAGVGGEESQPPGAAGQPLPLLLVYLAPATAVWVLHGAALYQDELHRELLLRLIEFMAPSKSTCPLVVIKIICCLKQKLKYTSILSVSRVVIEYFYLLKKKKVFQDNCFFSLCQGFIFNYFISGFCLN